MNSKQLREITKSYIENSQYNYISKEVSMSPEFVGMKIFDEPIFGFSSSEDKLFNEFKSKEIIGEHFMTPIEWLPDGKTVISFFLPFTKEIVKSNGEDFNYPSKLWLHGRIEGQLFVKKLTDYLLSKLSESGQKAMAPLCDSRFFSKAGSLESKSNEDFTSNWSERHVAYASGLGTFGLCKGLITERGMAGRLGSIITNEYFQPTVRKYNDIYEYCSNCGACIIHCPGKAISLENGKDHSKCNVFLEKVKEENKPYYGCGKCQVKTPCTFKIPKKS